MTKEHEAGKSSVENILSSARSEKDCIMKRMSSPKMATDKNIMATVLDKADAEFQKAWKDRRLSLARHAKFCTFASSLNQVNVEIHELTEMLKIKTGFEETLASVISASTYLKASREKVQELSNRVSKTEKEGQALAKDVPEHQASIEMGLKQLVDKWKGLEDVMTDKRQKLDSAMDYFQHLQQAETFIKEGNRSLLEWSRQV